jgi:hypothetical protein
MLQLSPSVPHLVTYVGLLKVPDTFSFASTERVVGSVDVDTRWRIHGKKAFSSALDRAAKAL